MSHSAALPVLAAMPGGNLLQKADADELNSAVARFKEDGREGRHDEEFVAQGSIAMHQRARGDFKAAQNAKFEHHWAETRRELSEEEDNKNRKRKDRTKSNDVKPQQFRKDRDHEDDGAGGPTYGIGDFDHTRGSLGHHNNGRVEGLGSGDKKGHGGYNEHNTNSVLKDDNSDLDMPSNADAPKSRTLTSRPSFPESVMKSSRPGKNGSNIIQFQPNAVNLTSLLSAAIVVPNLAPTHLKAANNVRQTTAALELHRPVFTARARKIASPSKATCVATPVTPCRALYPRVTRPTLLGTFTEKFEEGGFWKEEITRGASMVKNDDEETTDVKLPYDDWEGRGIRDNPYSVYPEIIYGPNNEISYRPSLRRP